MNRTVKQVVLGAAVIALVGCGGGGPSTPASSSARPAASSAASAGSTASPAPAPASDAPGVPSAPVLPSLPAVGSHADPAFEALLPAEVSGTALQRASYTMAEILDAGGADRAAINAFLTSIGKSEADGSVATALDPTGALGGGIIAFKVTGADPAALLAGILSVEQSDIGAGATATQATVGGKNVTVVSAGSGVNETEWLYSRGDVVFVVHANDEALAAAFLQALP